MAVRHRVDALPEMTMKNDVIIDLASEIIIKDTERMEFREVDEEDHAACRINFTRIVGAWNEYQDQIRAQKGIEENVPVTQ